MNGIKSAFTTERSLRIQTIIALVVVLAGIYFQVSRFEWLFICLNITMVISLEFVNTYVERLCDLVNPEYSGKVNIVKYNSAGAVLVAAIFATVSGFIIFYPYLERLFTS